MLDTGTEAGGYRNCGIGFENGWGARRRKENHDLVFPLGRSECGNVSFTFSGRIYQQ